MNTQELKEKADTLLALREDLYEMRFHQCDREWIIDAMLDFAAMNHIYFGEKSEKPINPTSSQTEISDEEIEKAMLDRSGMWDDPLCFEIGWKDAIKWYREQLKSRQNG